MTEKTRNRIATMRRWAKRAGLRLSMKRGKFTLIGRGAGRFPRGMSVDRAWDEIEVLRGIQHLQWERYLLRRGVRWRTPADVGEPSVLADPEAARTFADIFGEAYLRQIRRW
jgi:hypothetical protein